MFDDRRLRYLNNFQDISKGPIIYWMNREQRVDDNWALIKAQSLAFKYEQPVIVVFCLANSFLGATLRQYDFMLKGLAKVEAKLKLYNIAFVMLIGDAKVELPKFTKEIGAGAVVTDFSPIRIVADWKKSVAENITVPLIEIDAHNIVPCWVASNKLEFAAYTFRPKISKMLPDFLTDYPKLEKHPFSSSFYPPKIDWPKLDLKLNVDRSFSAIDWLKPGEDEANEVLSNFIQNNLPNYGVDRNNPNKNAQSNLSPYLHFGQISPQRIALEISKHIGYQESKSVFLEELVIRRELTDNFCYYNKNYDNFEGFPKWAQETLLEHTNDQREHIYTKDQFEQAKTQDPLWNAAQIEMMTKGKMHGYMRMYWAKKILEWTKTPEEALKIAIYLNDKYHIDGRDPNGYVGVAWSIGGVHDRPWFERPIFGKIRYMNYNGCKNKFSINDYMKKYNQNPK